MQKLTPKTILILFIMFSIAMLHVVGPAREAGGVWHDLYYSYFSDLVLPFGFYFLLCQAETKLPALRRWWVKAGLIFGAAFTAEVLQFFGSMHWGLLSIRWILSCTQPVFCWQSSLSGVSSYVCFHFGKFHKKV